MSGSVVSVGRTIIEDKASVCIERTVKRIGIAVYNSCFVGDFSVVVAGKCHARDAVGRKDFLGEFVICESANFAIGVGCENSFAFGIVSVFKPAAGGIGGAEGFAVGGVGVGDGGAVGVGLGSAKARGRIVGPSGHVPIDAVAGGR